MNLSRQHRLTRTIVAVGLAALVTVGFAQGAGAATTQPVVKISDQTRASLGGTPVKPADPVTTEWCKDSIELYWRQVDLYTTLKEAGSKESADIVLGRIKALDSLMDDFGCWGN